MPGTAGAVPSSRSVRLTGGPGILSRREKDFGEAETSLRGRLSGLTDHLRLM
jgi:hypothetical protein